MARLLSAPLQQHVRDLDQDDQHDRREIEAAEIGHDLADRPVERRRDPIERDGERANARRAGVEDVEGEQPAQDHLDKDDPEQDRQEIMRRSGKGRVACARLSRGRRAGQSRRETVGLGPGEDFAKNRRPGRSIRRSGSSRRRAAARARRARHICGCSRCGSTSPAAKRKRWPEIVELDVAHGDQMHLDPRQYVVPARLVAERVDRNVAVELAVDPVEQVEVELRPSPLRDRHRRRAAARPA